MGSVLFLVTSACVFRSFQTATCVCLSAETEPLLSVASDLETGERNQTPSIFCLLDCLPSCLISDTFHPWMFLSPQGVRRRIRACGDREPLSIDQQVSWSYWFSWSLSRPEALSGKPRHFALYAKLLSVCSSARHSAFPLRVKATHSERTGSQKCFGECLVMQPPHVGSWVRFQNVFGSCTTDIHNIHRSAVQLVLCTSITLLSEDKERSCRESLVLILF